MTPELQVRLFDDVVGTLAVHQGRLAFRYDTGWLSRPEARPLSSSLPLRPEPFEDMQARPYFAGLLPEGRMRQLLAKQFHVSQHNDFALLDHLGGECAGAVSFVEPDSAVAINDGSQDVTWFSDEALAVALAELPRRPLLAGTDGVRLSLAGAQEKLAVVVENGRIGLPRNNTPSTHILKPAISGVDDSVANEAFCMMLARQLGLPAANAVMSQVQGHDFLLVERYDRFRDQAGNLRRLHQEDFCQALGVPPEMKYQNEGGPDVAACFDLVRRVTRPSAPQLLRLLDMMILNALIGNHDAHGKNFSLLYRDAAAELAPLYDCLCTAVYEDLTTRMAMKIGSKYDFAEVLPRHWEQLAVAAGLSPAQTRKRVVALAKTLPRVAADTAHDFAERPGVARIVGMIEQRCALTLRRMGAAAQPDADDGS